MIEIGGSTGSTGSAPDTALESNGFPGAKAGTPASGFTGSTGSGAALVEVVAGPFAPLTDADHARGAAIPAGGGTAGDDRADVLTVMPSPDASPALATFRLRDRPDPSRVWLYRTAEGAVFGAVARYDTTKADGTPRKDVLPWTHGRREWTDKNDKARDATGWHCKAPPSPRPLYGLDRLARRPGAPVVVCEGEKAADAAGELFHDHVAITSQGGSGAADKSDWTALRGRNVTIWPDHDEPGAGYAAKVAALLRAAKVASVRVVEVPADWPDGWDVADTRPPDVAPERLRELLEGAPDVAALVLPDRFRMTDKGLLFVPAPTQNNPDPPPIFVAAPFQVIGQTCNDVREAWGVLLRWRDRANHPHEWAIPRRLIHRPGNEIAEQLEEAGLECGSDTRAHDLLKRFIGGVKTDRLLRCVTRTGWHDGKAGPVFVLPGGETFGPGAADVILQADHVRAGDAFRSAGTLAEWQDHVAALAVDNDRLALFVAAAFAGPLLDVMGEPSGGVHLVGDSRTGKSTAAKLAASVWGPPEANAQMHQWRGTANGLEATTAEISDTLLILDEMNQASSAEVGEVVYMITNEAGKQRASRTGGARRRQSWRTLFLSTGEITLAQKMAEAGRQAMAGLDVRLPNVPADAGAGMGVFQRLHGRRDAAGLVEQLRAAARAHHGTAARAFLRQLAADRAADAAGLRETLDELRNGFLAQHVPAGAAAQVRSVAGRFALIGAAGELARDYGVLPWPEGEAMRAAGACFSAWMDARGGSGSGEDARALAQVRAFLEAHGESRFTPLFSPAPGGDAAAPDLARTINRAGFRRRLPDAAGGERWEYLILPEAWKNEVCKGLDPKRTADVLATGGFLTGGTPRHRAAAVNIPNEGKRRVYVVSGALLGGAAGGGDDGTE